MKTVHSENVRGILRSRSYHGRTLGEITLISQTKIWFMPIRLKATIEPKGDQQNINYLLIVNFSATFKVYDGFRELTFLVILVFPDYVVFYS